MVPGWALLGINYVTWTQIQEYVDTSTDKESETVKILVNICHTIPILVSS